MDFDFSEQPTVGTVILLDEQQYELVGVEPYRRRDGRKTELLVWATQCANCQSPFEVKTPLRTNGFSRRCAACRKPGKPVQGKRGRKVKVAMVEA
ncbi:hypothetical protein [Rhizorhapis sp.]|uniref:hypothetical protein n=1 Tax=Rhizorhapis sp. TaxID=1968842 RepID=UPI002B46B9B1|nr:hypothetical protein [Rhizorhapis sp.]HKR17644.1 hypothetical protein [Rhizorhapis sp.]